MKNNEQEIDKGLKLIMKSSIIVFIGLFLSKIFIFAYRIIIARYFGAEIYGLFSLALMIIGWFIAFSSFGLNDGLLRYVSFYRGKKEINKIRYIIKFSLIILFFSTLISTILLFSLSEFISINIFHNSDLIIFLKIFSFLIPFSVFSSTFLLIMNAYEEIGWLSFFSNVLQNFVKLFFLVLLIFFGFKTNSVIFSYFLSILVLFLASYLFSKYYLSEIFGKYSLEKNLKSRLRKEIISYSFPLMFLSVIASIFYWADSFFIGFFKSSLEVGIYNVAIPIVLLLTFAPNLFVHLFFPLITKEYSRKNFELIKELSKQVSKWIFIINLPIFIFIFFFPGTIINILFGAEYLSAENSLRILSLGLLVSSSWIILPTLIQMMGKSKIYFWDMVFALILNIILNYFLIPMKTIFFIENSLGINGAAMATTISTIFLNFLFLLQVKNNLSFIPLRRKILRILAISIIPTFILVYLKKFVSINPISLILLGSFFILLYILLILLTGCLDRNDIMILKSFKKKLSKS